MTEADERTQASQAPGALTRRPGITDVSRAFRLILCRDLESAAVAGVHIAHASDIWDLIETIWASPEAKHRQLAESLRIVRSAHESALPSTNPGPTKLDALYRAMQDRWRKMGLGPQYKHLISKEPRFSERSVRSNLAQTLERGKAEWSDMCRQFDRLGWQRDTAPAVTILGVEAFRLLGADEVIASELIAVELLEADVAKGRRAEHLTQAQAARLLTFGEAMDELPATDIFYSVSALQYAPPPVILDTLRRCLRCVKDGGYAVFQLPASLHDYTFDSADYLNPGEGGEIMAFHCVPQADILAILADEGFRVVEVLPDERASVFGLSYTYFARRGFGGIITASATAGDALSISGALSFAGQGRTADKLDAPNVPEKIVEHLYQAVLGRNADAPGLEHYTEMIWDDGCDDRTVTSMLIGSAEYRERVGGVVAGHAEQQLHDCHLLLPAETDANPLRDPWVLPYLLDRCATGSALLDLGTGIGIFSATAARRIDARGRVYAATPSGEDLSLFLRNLSVNKLENVELLPIAEGRGVAAASSAVVLDQLRPFLRKIDILRMDASGIANRVLYGALDLIRSDRPTMFLEYAHSREDERSQLQATRLLKLLVGMGYRCEILHREQPRQRVDAGEAVATVEAAWKVWSRAGGTHLDLCFHPVLSRG